MLQPFSPGKISGWAYRCGGEKISSPDENRSLIILLFKVTKLTELTALICIPFISAI
jgi:hypothetical protein